MESTLTAAERKTLKARAHNLNPILQLGEKGLTDAVIAEIDRALAAHELIKIRAAPLNHDEREVALASICERTNAHAIQHIGKMLIVYRKKPEQESPRPRPQRRSTPARGERTGFRASPRRPGPARRPRRTSPVRPTRSRKLKFGALKGKIR
jgi:RNA-binding protein